MAASSLQTGRILGASAFFFFFSLFLTAYSVRNPELGRFGYRLADEVIYPFQALHRGFFNSVAGLWREYLDLRGVRKENLVLRDRLQALEGRNSALLEFEFQNNSLRSLLDMTGQHTRLELINRLAARGALKNRNGQRRTIPCPLSLRAR